MSTRIRHLLREILVFDIPQTDKQEHGQEIRRADRLYFAAFFSTFIVLQSAKTRYGLFCSTCLASHTIMRMFYLSNLYTKALYYIVT